MNEVEKNGLSIVANRYAAAMIDLAEKQDLLDTVETNLYLIKNVVDTSPEFREFIDHPLINVKDKKEVLENIFKENILPCTMNLIRLLADNKRLYLLGIIAGYYNKILCKKRNIDTAEVITAISIDETTINKVKEKLEKMFDKQIKIKLSVDKEIIAGMIVKIDDKIIDGSIKTKFENMKKQLC